MITSPDLPWLCASVEDMSIGCIPGSRFSGVVCGHDSSLRTAFHSHKLSHPLTRTEDEAGGEGFKDNQSGRSFRKIASGIEVEDAEEAVRLTVFPLDLAFGRG